MARKVTKAQVQKRVAKKKARKFKLTPEQIIKRAVNNALWPVITDLVGTYDEMELDTIAEIILAEVTDILECGL